MTEEKKPTYAQRAVVAESEVERLTGLLARGHEEHARTLEHVQMLEIRLNDAAEKIAQLEKKAKDHESTREYYNRRDNEQVAEIEGFHLLLDAIPGAPERKMRDANGYERTFSLAMRFTAAVVRGCFNGGAA
jgi:hypothetical protein